MDKQTAIDLLGGTVTSAACAVGVTPSAVTQWPDVLPPRTADRVQAALWRIANRIPHPVPQMAKDAQTDKAPA